MKLDDRTKSLSEVRGQGDVQGRKSYFKPKVLLFLYALSFSLAIPAFPKQTLIICDGDSALSVYYYGLSMTARYVTETLCSPLMGTLADVAGRRPVFLLSTFTGGIEFVAFALFPSIETLFICRVLSGLGDSGIATAFTIFTDIATYNHDNLTQTFGEVAAIVILAFVVGPLAGGVINEYVSPRACLLVSATCVLICFMLAYFNLEESLGYNGADNSDKIQYLRTGVMPQPADKLRRNRNSTASASDVSTAAPRESSVSVSNYENLHSTMSGQGLSMKGNQFGSRQSTNNSEASSASNVLPENEICRAIYDSDDDDIKPYVRGEGEAECACCNVWCPYCITSSSTLNWVSRFFIIANPLPSMSMHLRKRKMRQLMFPLFLGSVGTGGLISIWYIYLDYKFQTNSIQIGYYLSSMAFATSAVQGGLLKVLVPKILTEKQAVYTGYWITSMQFLVIAWAPTFGWLFASLIFLVGSITVPTMKGLLVKESMVGELQYESTARQGNLQGTLNALDTAGSALGSLVLSNIFSWSTKLSSPKVWIPFVCVTALTLVCGFWTFYVFQQKEWKTVRSSRLSTDAPTTRPLTEEDFLEETDETDAAAVTAAQQYEPLLA